MQNKPNKRWSSSKKTTSRIKVRLTKAGWGYLVLTLVILLMGINYANNLIYALAYFLMSLLIIGYLQTQAQLTGLEFKQWRCDTIFSGQNILYQIQISKKAKYNTEAKSWGLYAGYGTLDIPQLYLSSKLTKQLNFKILVNKRGLYQHDRVNVLSTYPFGLFRASMSTPKLPECFVYPQAIGQIPLSKIITGDTASHHIESESITSIRTYVAGDNLSRVAWKSLARRDELMTKEFDGAQGDPVLILNWQQQELALLAIEPRLSQLCKWILEADRAGKEFSLILPNNIIPAGTGSAHLHSCLQALALFNNGEPSD